MCKGRQSNPLRIVIIIVFVLLASSATSTEGKGHAKKPPGWEKGKKEGWKSSLPSGLKKKGTWLPPGLSEAEQAEWKNGRPPGWSRGEKRGWQGRDMPPGLTKKGEEYPPGWGKWSKEKRKEWEKELRKAREKVRNRVKNLKEFSAEDANSALLSIERAARKGVPIKYALGFVEEALEKGIRGRGIETATRAMAYGVGKEIDFEQLGKFVHKKLEEGLRGDNLSVEIYKEIVRCQKNNPSSSTNLSK